MVDVKEVSKKGVLTKFDRLTVERYPAVPRPATVDCKEADETYPNVPKPIVVDVTFESNPTEERNPIVPNPIIVDVNSVGSINVLIYVVNPWVVETSC